MLCFFRRLQSVVVPFSYENIGKILINLCQHGTAFCLFGTSVVFTLLTLQRYEHIIGIQQELLSEIPHGAVDIQCMYTLCKLKLRSVESQRFNFIFMLLYVFVYIHKIPCILLLILDSHLFMQEWLTYFYSCVQLPKSLER